MNKKGFTLIEILAVIVIIGIVSSIGIVAVSSNIERARKSDFTALARAYGEAARTMKGSDLLGYDPKEGEAVLVPFTQVKGVEVENGDKTAYGDIVEEYCYVVITKENGMNKYYVTLVDESGHTMIGVDYNEIDDKLVKSDNEGVSTLQPVSYPLSAFAITLNEKTYRIKRMRVKFETDDETVITGYFASDGSEAAANANVHGPITDFDQALNVQKVTYNGNQYPIAVTNILYIALTSN